MKRKNHFMVLSLVMLFGFLSLTATAIAAQVTLTWDANEPKPINGYRALSRTSGQDYDKNIYEWSGEATTCTIYDLDEGVDHFFVVVACNGDSIDDISDYSNEVRYYAPSIYDLGDEYSTIYGGGDPSNDDINYDLDTISLTIPSAIDINTIRNYAWLKNLENTFKGKIVRVSFDARVLDGSDNSLIFMRLEDSNRISNSPERGANINAEWQSYTFDIVIMSDEPISLYNYALLPGDYQFTRITTEIIEPETKPATFVYLKRLKPSTLGNRFTAVFGIDLPIDSDGIRYIVANNQLGIENDYDFSGTLGPGIDEIEVEINASVSIYGGLNTYQGVFVKVINIFGESESAPFITAYLPGNSHDTADDGELLFCQLAVDDIDVQYARQGYYYRTDPAYRNTEPYGAFPASTNERVDVDNNTFSGYAQDWSFARFMNIYYKRLKIFPEN